jgi:hypothetical protein
MTFAHGVGPVDPPDVPSLDPIPLAQLIPLVQSIVPYNAVTHSYRFVIDVGSTPKFLTIGDGDGGIFDNSGQYSIQLFAVTQGIPFGNFTGRVKANIKAGQSDNKVEVDARFALGTGSDGINPATETVTIQIGKLSLTIPAGSFTENKNGFKFEGTIASVDLKVNIKRVKNEFSLDLNGVGADLTGSELPLGLALLIGNDAGNALLTNAKLTAESE